MGDHRIDAFRPVHLLSNHLWSDSRIRTCMDEEHFTVSRRAISTMSRRTVVTVLVTSTVLALILALKIVLCWQTSSLMACVRNGGNKTWNVQSSSLNSVIWRRLFTMIVFKKKYLNPFVDTPYREISFFFLVAWFMRAIYSFDLRN